MFNDSFPLITDFIDSEEELIALGGDYQTELLKEAYSKGLFPWPHEGVHQIPWFSPNPRAIIKKEKFHFSHSLRKSYRQKILSGFWKVTLNQNFKAVIDACASTPRKGHEPGTWINPELKAAYLKLHTLGLAHSVEVWDEAQQLVGGLYGVDALDLKTMRILSFSAESMFHLKSNASKLALIALFDWLHHTRHLDWVDVQVMNPHLKSLGAEEVSREDFYKFYFKT